MLELAIAAASDKALGKPIRPIVARARKSLNRIWLDSLRAAGYSPASAEKFILLTHYLLRGVFVVSTWLPYETNRRAVIDAWSALAPAILDLDQHETPLMRVPGAGKRPLRRRSALRRNKKA
jgi:hypothetical protein